MPKRAAENEPTTENADEELCSSTDPAGDLKIAAPEVLARRQKLRVKRSSTDREAAEALSERPSTTSTGLSGKSNESSTLEIKGGASGDTQTGVESTDKQSDIDTVLTHPQTRAAKVANTRYSSSSSSEIPVHSTNDEKLDAEKSMELNRAAGSSSCLPPVETLTNTKEYESPFRRHVNEAETSNSFLANISADQPTETASPAAAFSWAPSTASSSSGGLFGGLGVLGGGSTRSTLFEGTPAGCGLFPVVGSSYTANGAVPVLPAEDLDDDDSAKPEEVTPLETVTNDDEENVFQDASCKFSKLVKPDSKSDSVTSEWIPAVFGKVEVNRPKGVNEGTPRILFRHNGSGRLLLNTDIMRDASYASFKNKSVIFNGRQIDNEAVLVPYRLTFESEQGRTLFRDKVLELQKTVGTPNGCRVNSHPQDSESSA